MKFLDLKTIKILLLTIKEMNVLDIYSKNFLEQADRGFFYNCMTDKLDVAKWLYNCGISSDYNYNYTFRECCGHGFLNMAQWLYLLGHVTSTEKIYWGLFSHDGEPIDNCSTIQNAFCIACEKGHLDVMQWLYMLHKDNLSSIDKNNYHIDIHFDNEYAFRIACKCGYMDIAQWLVQISLDEINIYAKKSSISGHNAFENACSNNRLDIAKWLEQIDKNDRISCMDIDDLFRRVCLDNYLEMAKWLYSHWEIDLTVHNDWLDDVCTFGGFLFMKACHNGHEDMAKWLYSLGRNVNGATDQSANNEPIVVDLFANNEYLLKKAITPAKFDCDWLLDYEY